MPLIRFRMALPKCVTSYPTRRMFGNMLSIEFPKSPGGHRLSVTELNSIEGSLMRLFEP